MSNPQLDGISDPHPSRSSGARFGFCSCTLGSVVSCDAEVPGARPNQHVGCAPVVFEEYCYFIIILQDTESARASENVTPSRQKQVQEQDACNINKTKSKRSTAPRSRSPHGNTQGAQACTGHTAQNTRRRKRLASCT